MGGEKAQGQSKAEITFETLFLDTPLYATHTISEKSLENLRARAFQFDGYCLFCSNTSTLKRFVNTHHSPVVVLDWARKPGYFDISLHCARHHHESKFYFFAQAVEGADELTIQKIGQMPSLEDLSGADIAKYRSILGGYYTELRKATGLASHGIGIGSFVYLRRIFETLIERHRKEFEAANGPIDEYDRKRMDEKISALKSVLPPALVTHRKTYAILSKGLHELDEDATKKYFPAVRAAIIQILEQDFQAKKRAKEEEELAKTIASIHLELGTAGEGHEG